MTKYKLCNIKLLGKTYEVSHEFTDDDIEEILQLPRVGIGVSFQKAYEMRFMENYSGISLINTTLIRKSLAKYITEKGLYIHFENNELNCMEIEQEV